MSTKFYKKPLLILTCALIGLAGVGIGIFLNKVVTKQEKNMISFYGKHQSGIETPAQNNIYFAVLTLNTNDKEEVKKMFKDWTEYSAKLMKGELVGKERSNKLVPPTDTGEAIGLNTQNLTITFGVSPSFLDKLGLENKKMKEFKDLPHFSKDQLKEEFTGGDICIQVCADDPQVAFHAVRNLFRKARSTVSLKWAQAGFAPITGGKTPRNLFGFKDGTENQRTEEQLNANVWYDKDDWLKDGSFLIVRKIQMFLETWDRTNLQEQENTFGRYKESGAPFGKKDEFDEIDMSKQPLESHVKLAKEANSKILRRGYSYANGVHEVTGQFDTGLLFISYQKDPEQFIKIQNSLGADDKLNEYITHIGSGIFACFPGVKEGEYIGQKLFE